ncbi:MAG: site-specific DNA-methyltransferase [Candidatus Pacebacteria bacterium]|nr:site-specific DNA-methyltransferase [Candidatus Paceibacterota bacterium]
MSEEILKLKKEIERLRKAVKKQRYGLVWMDVPEAFEDDVENKLPILKEVSRLAIKNSDGKPTHILIEGDNYHALSCLNYTHKGKIDVIYIDPPYNTGSDGFKYKDKRILDKYPDGTEVPKDHPFRHSYWLSFMSKRLELAKDILKESGAIFISIDDNEFAQLKLLCDEIFNPLNFVNIIVWKKTNSPKAQANQLGNQHEFVLVYAKNIEKLSLNKFVGGVDEKYKKSFTYDDNDGRGPYQTVAIIAGGTQRSERRKSFDFHGVVEQWLYKKETLEKWWQENRIYKTKNGQYRLKKYLSETEGRMLSDIWIDEEIKALQGGSEEYIGFTTQKPLSLIKRIFKLSSDKNSIILDFFAGSGTTGEAVINLNKDDEGSRQFILVTNNDEVVNGTKHKIMSDVCYPRIKKISKNLKNGVKFYRTSFIGKNNILNATDQDKIELAHNAGELLAIAENTLELAKQNKFYQLFENSEKQKYTAVYFREELDKFDEFSEIVRKFKKPTTIYIFSWGDEEFCDDFTDLKQVKVKTIPVPILEIYKQIYNLSTE